jgi:hypothetical protein
MEADAVDLVATISGCNHVNDHRSFVEEAEKCGGTAMRDESTFATGQDRRVKPTALVNIGASDCKDTAEDLVEPPRLYGVVDCAIAEPDRPHLGTRHHSVLPTSQMMQVAITISGLFPPHRVDKSHR